MRLRGLAEGSLALDTTDGRPLTLRLGGTERIGAALRPDDPDLRSYVIVDGAPTARPQRLLVT